MKTLKDFSKKQREMILQEAHERFKTVHDANYDLRESFKKNMKFSFNIDNGQWNSATVDEREDARRPYLTSNKLGKFVAQVVNQEKGVPDTDDVVPVDDKGDDEIAKVYNDLIQDIHYQSSIEDIYGLACKFAVGGGYGYWRYVAEWTDEGFDQELKAKPIKNPLMVDIDPREKYAFVREGIPAKEFERLHPKSERQDFYDCEDEELWYEEDKVFIAEYFRKIPVKKTIAEVYDPKTRETGIYEITEENEKEIRKLQILRKREADSNKIEWFKVTGTEILDYKEWPGKHIPIVEVSGDEVYLEGVTYKKALTTDAQDPQKMYNYWLTSNTEKVALSPKAPIMATPEQIANHEEMWDEANTKNFLYLLYNNTGQGAPKRLDPPAIDQAAITMIGLANNDINDVLGRYESSVGASSNERSGKAIDARNARSDLTSYTFSDNFRKAKIKGKRILVDLIPKIYDNQRIIRLRNTGEEVPINYQTLNDQMEKIIVNDLSRGRYDIRVKSLVNPTRRQQVASLVRDALQYAPPEYAPVLLPLLFEYSDATGSDEILNALKQIPPPQPKGSENIM